MKVLAVSGGVDSMVMLDLMCKKYPAKELLVAHFNHNARKSAQDDMEFVRKIATKYQVQFVSATAPKQQSLSEQNARSLRYEFLQSLGGDSIYVAHHLDDLVESIAINLSRGTGWRGLAVMNNATISRPFLTGEFDNKIYDQRDVLRYAAKNQIIFRQDPTNNDSLYLRNRLRPSILNLSANIKNQLFELRESQCEISQKIYALVDELISGSSTISRQIFHNLDETIAIEILRIVLEKNQIACTRPQLKDFLNAIKTYQPGKKFNLPSARFATISREYFTLPPRAR